MTEHKSFETEPTGLILVRSPLLPIDAFIEGSPALTKQAEVRAAMWFASPGFLGRADDKDSGLALARYLSRLAGRPTPFGLMAGTSLGHVSAETHFVMQARDRYVRRYSIRPGALRRIVDRLVADCSTHWLRIAPNTSLVSIAGRYHYVELAGDTASHVAIEGPPLLSDAIELARQAPTIEALGHQLEELSGLPEEKCRALVRELIDQQVLVPEAVPAVSSESPAQDLFEALSEAPATQALLGNLAAQIGEAESVDDFQEVNKKLAAPAHADANRPLLQAELIKPAPGLSISGELVDEVGEAVRWLHAWQGGAQPDPLADFRSAFIDRYGSKRVPLGVALDPEAGIGSTVVDVAPALLGDLVAADSVAATGQSLSDRKLEILVRRLDSESECIEMRDEDLASNDSCLPLPNEFAVLGHVATADAFCLHGVAGPPASMLLARHAFAHEVLRASVRDFAKIDAAAHDAVIAEVLYAPTHQLADIQARPVLSDYEIPYLGRSALPAERQLPLDDLSVSVVDGVIRIDSQKLDRRVLPRLSTPHDFRRDRDPIYRFLCSLQSQGVCPRLAWSWGSLDERAFLPRVRHGKVLLALARWRLDDEEIRHCVGSHSVAGLRRARKLPRFVYLLGDDRRLLCDFESSRSIDVFIDEVRGHEAATLEEMFPPPDALMLAGPEGRFVHDVVIPFRRRSPYVVQEVAVPEQAHPDATPANDEWLYFKLYSGPATADRLLKRLGPELLALPAGWHFLRYSDPNPQLRLRVPGDPEQLRDTATRLQALLDAEQAAGLLWRIERADYVPETERYGGADGLRYCEQIFHHDSVAALEIVSTFAGDTDARWLAAMRGINVLFDAFDVALPTRIELLKAMQAELFAAFDVPHGKIKAAVGQRYRRDRDKIEAALGDGAAEKVSDTFFAPGDGADEKVSDTFFAAVGSLCNLDDDGGLTRRLDAVVASLVHMHCNRVLRWPARRQECFLYGFLERYYRSTVARLSDEGLSSR